ncbi:MAG: XdhC family protein, partial [Clostridia bacterium]|nr:XdhC family protein [Clostridia bacterium]
MYKRIVHAIRNGHSPFLFTGIDADHMGKTAVTDGESVYGERSIIRTIDEDKPLPRIEDGILIERIITPPHLVLCGAGHVSVYTAKIAKMIGFRVTVIDERDDFANRNRFPDADEIINLPFREALQSITDTNTYFVIVTRGHKDDNLCLRTILDKPYTYCGMIGSRSKIQVVFDDLLANGYTEEKLKSIHSPIGLSIGANTPEEIAVCIAGEMIQVKNAENRGSEWDAALCNAIETMRKPYAMVTLIEKTGSAPRSIGARMIVKRDGTIISSIGGGYGEFEASQHAA